MFLLPSLRIRRSLALILAISMTVLQTPPARSQSILAAGTFGGALIVGLNKIGDLIRQAREAGNDLLLGAGVEIQNAITSAQIAYEDSLKKTIDQLNEAEKKAVTDVDAIVQTAMAKGLAAAHELLTRTQLIANTLPFASKIPQLGGYGPHFLVPGGETIPLQISGNFPFGFDRTNAPFLTVGGKPISAAAYGTTFMSFNVPKAACGAASTNDVRSCSLSLTVPWDASRWFNIFGRNIKQGVFRVEFGVLPATPGSFKLFHQKAGSQHEELPRASDVFTFDSSDNDIEENRSLHLSAGEISDGWRIKPNSARFDLVQHIEGVEGHDWYNMGYQGGSDVEVIWRARTERKHVGSSGKIRWRIVCTMQRDVPTSTTVPEDVPAQWSLSRTFDYPAGKWKLTWTRFDGSIHDFNGTDIDSNFVKVVANGDSFRLTTYGQQ